MAGRMKRLPKLVLLGVIAAGAVYGANWGLQHGYIPNKGILKSLVPEKAALKNEELKDVSATETVKLVLPSTKANGCQDPIRNEIWAWNAYIGWLLSNGGADTTKGSLAEKYGACEHFNRQDDTTQMKNDMLACANQLKDSTECTAGIHTVTIMGDGAGQWIAHYNAEAGKICKDCTAEIIGTTGFSRGEDALWGPEEWKRDPRAMLGDGLIAGVLLDGDWNTAEKYIGDNGLKNNPDEHTFDVDAVNWVNAKDYLDAPEKYIAGYCEDRKVVKDGRPTGETRNVCVKGVVTWTPGDVNIATKKGGIVRIVSTKQYRAQMPSAIIGIKKWDRAHSDQIAKMLAAAMEGGDQIKAYPQALTKAGEISAQIYCASASCGEESSGSYWVKYYKGVVQKDKTGRIVDLGGSYADNMNDALNVFGITPGTNNNMKATYSIFAAIDMQQYPDLFKDSPIPPYESAATANYLLQAKSLMDNSGAPAETPTYTASSGGDVISRKNFHIEFATGSDQLTPQGLAVVREIRDSVAITGLAITINGHTDNTGNPQSNLALSENRARSVMRELQKEAPKDFPTQRFTINGYGQDKPIASNATPDGRAKNRRVEIQLAE